MLGAFESVIGHEPQKRYLRTVLEKKSRAHAYIFHGPHGIGKEKMARAFIAAVLGIREDELSRYPDLIELTVADEEKTTIGVDDVSRVRERLAMSSFGGVKVALIPNAERLTPAAQNAFLKTLEEPSGDSLLLFTVSSLDVLLQTIVSRSVAIRFALVSQKDLYEYLLRKGLEHDIAREVSVLARGKPGRAMQLLLQEERERTREERNKKLSILTSPVPERLRYTDDVLKATDKSRGAILDETERWKELLHDLLLASSGYLGEESLNTSTIDVRRDISHWAHMLDETLKTERALKTNANVQIAFEQFLIHT